MSTTKFPAALDDGSSMPNPGSGDLVASVDHANQHDVINDAAKAIEGKVGIGASTPVANTLLRGTGTGTTAYAQAALTTDVSGTLPVVNGGSGVTSKTGTGNLVLSNSPTLSAPVFTTISNTGTLTLPTSTDTLVGRATTDTLTNKTLTSPIVDQFSSASGVGAAWTTWAPSFTNVTGGTLNFAKFSQIGKTVRFRLKYTLAGAGISGGIIFSLPVTANSDYSANDPITGRGTMLQTGVQGYTGTLIFASTTTVEMRPEAAAAAYTTYGTPTSSTVPFTWANTHVFSVSGEYEGA